MVSGKVEQKLFFISKVKTCAVWMADAKLSFHPYGEFD